MGIFGGKKIKTKKGKEFTYLTPGKKSRKFVDELRTNQKITNDGMTVKRHGLTETERAYRAGYLDRGKESAIMHNLKNGKPGKGKSQIKKNVN